MRRREGQEKGTQKALDETPIERKNIQRQASRTLSEPIHSKQLLLPGESSVLQCEKFQKWYPSHILFFFFSRSFTISLTSMLCSLRWSLLLLASFQRQGGWSSSWTVCEKAARKKRWGGFKPPPRVVEFFFSLNWLARKTGRSLTQEQ